MATGTDNSWITREACPQCGSTAPRQRALDGLPPPKGCACGAKRKGGAA